jgi:hypothetical protein
MRERAISARHVFLRHPWAAVLMESRLMQSPVRHGGFTVPMAYRAFLLIDSYLYGFIMQEVNWPFDEADIPQVAEAMTAQMSPADHPHLVEVTGHVMTMSVEGKFEGCTTPSSPPGWSSSWTPSQGFETPWGRSRPFRSRPP